MDDLSPENAAPVPQPPAPGKARVALDAALAKVRLWQEAASFSVIAFAVALGLAALGWTWFSGPGWEEHSGFFRRGGAVAEPQAPAQPMVRRALDGVLVPEGTPEPDYVAVMIDNLADAYPLSGVSHAPLVYEAPVEGGITRLMAVYPSDAEIPEIGPVRSARPYFVDWSQELGALYAHVGGSPEALEKLRGSDVRDLNEFSAGRFFWREPKRRAPHNVYVSSETMREALRTRERNAVPLQPWKHKDDAAIEGRPEDTFETTLGEQGKWRVRWRYDREANTYERVLATGPQKDADGSPVLAKNVLVQFTEVRILDEIGRRRIDTVGGGEALVLMDGRTIGATWRFDTSTGRTRFFDAAGNELSLNAGVTWVEILPTGTPVTH